MFRLTVTQSHYKADSFQDGGEYLTIVNVGYDDESSKSYSAALGLSPQAGGDLEFFFHLVEADGETESEHAYWCGKDVARFIMRPDRQVILDIIIRETDTLLRRAKPEKVHCVTVDEYPPDRALVKHFLIADVFSSCGYLVHTADVWHGKRVWWMELLTEGGC